MNTAVCLTLQTQPTGFAPHNGYLTAALNKSQQSVQITEVFL